MIYEGKLLNGERNGKGKEYYNDIIIFEGEFVNGIKLNGKGKEYYDDCKLKLKFEGENINGEKNGILYNRKL